MKKELENKLYHIDPIFFEDAIACQNKEKNEMDTCMYWGCECGDGWFKPLEKFIHKVKFINELAKNYNTKFVCEQLKQKYGELRIYYKCDKIDKNIENNQQQEVKYLVDMFQEALKKAEDDCWNICEWCGKDGGQDGENLTTTSGWISRICIQCSQKEIQNKTKKFDKEKNQQYIPRITLFEQGYYFLNMFYTVGFSFQGHYYHSIIQAYIINKDPKHESFYRKIQSSNMKCTSYLNYDAFLNFGCKMQQNDYDLIKNITFARFNYEYNKKDLVRLLRTENMKLQNMGIHHNNIFGNCVCDKCKDIEHKDLYAKILMEVRNELLKKHDKVVHYGDVYWIDGKYYVVGDADVDKHIPYEFHETDIVKLRYYLQKNGIKENQIKVWY